jgi:hypothetical protein
MLIVNRRVVRMRDPAKDGLYLKDCYLADWRKFLTLTGALNEHAEIRVYRDLGNGRIGEERRDGR